MEGLMSPLLHLVAVTVIITLMIERVIRALCFREVPKKAVEAGTQTDLPRVSIPAEDYVVAATGSAYHKPSCYHINRRRVTRFRPCLDCVGRQLFVNGH